MSASAGHLPSTDERGATSTEYALLVALVAVVIIAGTTAFGLSVNALYDRSCDQVANAATGAAC